MIYAGQPDVVACYRLLLSREPDVAGLKNFTDLVDSADVTPFQLARLFMNSPEFINIQQRTTEASLIIRRVPMRDLDFVMDVAPDWNPINRVIADSGCYEPNVTRELVKCLHAGMTFVDCGANIGYFTLLACSLGAHVWSFEPNSRNVWLLLRNLKINSFHAEVYPSALAERERILVYSSIEGNGQVEELGSQLIGDSQEIVRTVVLDKVLEGVSVDVMKIDIEGAEAVALMGASVLLEKLPTIFLEFSPTNIENVSKVEALTFLDGLIQSGYRAEIITDEGLESHPPQDICDIAMQSQGCFVDLKLTANRHGTA